MITDEQFVEYVKKHGWIRPLTELSLKELFEHQRQVGFAIEKKIKELKL